MQQKVFSLVNHITNDIEGNTILRCHKVAALLVTLFNTGPYNIAEESGPEATFANDFRAHACMPNIYLCCCPLSFIGASHSWVVITVNAFALHLESNSPNWSLKKWLAGTPVDSSHKAILTPVRWLSIETYAQLAEQHMDDLTDCVVDWQERAPIRWARYPINADFCQLFNADTRAAALNASIPFQLAINQTFGS